MINNVLTFDTNQKPREMRSIKPLGELCRDNAIKISWDGTEMCGIGFVKKVGKTDITYVTFVGEDLYLRILPLDQILVDSRGWLIHKDIVRSVPFNEQKEYYKLREAKLQGHI